MKISSLMCDFGYGPFHVAHIVVRAVRFRAQISRDLLHHTNPRK